MHLALRSATAPGWRGSGGSRDSDILLPAKESQSRPLSGHANNTDRRKKQVEVRYGDLAQITWAGRTPRVATRGLGGQQITALACSERLIFHKSWEARLTARFGEPP